jgi:hypothetical protein
MILLGERLTAPGLEGVDLNDVDVALEQRTVVGEYRELRCAHRTPGGEEVHDDRVAPELDERDLPRCPKARQ